NGRIERSNNRYSGTSWLPGTTTTGTANRSANLRASWNCRGLARCVRSPDSTTTSGLWRSANSSTFSARSGRWGGPKWTSEMWRRCRTASGAALPTTLVARVRADVLVLGEADDGIAELRRHVAGERRHHQPALGASDPEAGRRRHHHRGARVARHQVAPVEALGQELVGEVLAVGVAERPRSGTSSTRGGCVGGHGAPSRRSSDGRGAR